MNLIVSFSSFGIALYHDGRRTCLRGVTTARRSLVRRSTRVREAGVRVFVGRFCWACWRGWLSASVLISA